MNRYGNTAQMESASSDAAVRNASPAWSPWQLLALRNQVPDGVLLDALELAALLPELPASIRTSRLREHWHCSQPTVSRRLTRLWDAGLLDYRHGGRRYIIRRVGPL